MKRLRLETLPSEVAVTRPCRRSSAWRAARQGRDGARGGTRRSQDDLPRILSRRMTRASRRRGKEGRRAVSGPASPVWPASKAAAIWLLYTRTAHRGCRDPWAERHRKSAIWASAGLGIVEPSKGEARR
jgi:hypothetical protein